MDSLSYYSNQYLPIQQPWMQNVSNSPYLGTTAPAYTGTMSCFPNETIFNSTWTPNFYSSTGFSNIPILGTTTSSSSTSSSSATADEPMTIEQYDAMKAERRRQKAKEKEADKEAASKSPIVFKQLTKEEEQKLIEYATKKLEYHENLGTSLALGAGLGVALPNMRVITSPFSSAKSAFSKKSEVNDLFKNVVNQDIWKNSPGELQQLYTEVHKAEVRYNKWNSQQLFKRKFTEDEFLKLLTNADDAISSGNKQKILEATEQLRQANSMKQGWISQGWRKFTDLFRKSPKAMQSVDDVINNTESIQSGVKSLADMTDMSLKGSFKSSLGGKLGILFAFTSLISEWRYIKAGFESKDKDLAWKQLGQSVAKAASSWGGYVIGDALGKWGGAKLGAALGTAICPGLGTAIGAVSGILLGTVCSWGLRKITNKLVGDNLANPLIAKNDVAQVKGDEEKQKAYLQNLIAEAQNDKNLDEETAKVLEKAAQVYLA